MALVVVNSPVRPRKVSFNDILQWTMGTLSKTTRSRTGSGKQAIPIQINSRLFKAVILNEDLVVGRRRLLTASSW